MGALRLFVNATVLTMDPTFPRAEALAVRDGRIVAVGSTDELLWLRQGDCEVVDLEGRTVLPGFVDAHNHFAIAALEGFWADCRTPPLRSIAEIQAKLGAAAREAPPGEWVRGWGYHHAVLAERRHPTRHELDEAVADRPVLLLHFSHHQGVANSKALAAAGITRATPDPPGGEIARDKAGEPTGLLFERAMAPVERASREGWEARFPEAAAGASRRYAACGLTTVQDAAVSPAMERRYRDAEASGRLGIRVQRMATSASGWFDPPWELARGPAHGGVLKLFVDGGYRCAMRLPRDGREVTSGFLFYRREELADMLVAAWRAGWRVTCHALGNLGVEVAVEALEDAFRREPSGEGRVRIDHAMFVTRELLGRIRSLGVCVVTQPNFVYDLGGPSRELPPGLIHLAFGSLLEQGIPQAFSSDYPCGSLAPLAGIYAAATRRSRDGQTVSAEEAVPVPAALQAYTIAAARATGIGDECGSLEAGKHADLVVLDSNPLDIPPDALLGINVIKTFVAGEEVWP
ncbi:MAG: amidohydrolase [Candidatus Rokubacteria bacterium]|nr:amidohydrolase [Candidatus Rokubacteria bacterium]